MLNWLKTFRKEWLLRRAVRNGLRLGENVRIVGNCDFGSEPYLIRIGNNVTISFDVSFVTHDGGTWIFRDEAEYLGITRYGPIRIDDGCFIGARAIILPGVHVGQRSLVGAGAVVIRDVPPNTVVAGVPARIIMTRAEYIQKCVKAGQHVTPRGKKETLSNMFGKTLG